MLQEDNGDNFEIIDKRIEDMSESVSSISSSASLIQPATAPATMSAGNLLSNVAPPSSLPNFITKPLGASVDPVVVVTSATQSLSMGQSKMITPTPPVLSTIPASTTSSYSLKSMAPHVQTIPSYQLPPTALPTPITQSEPFYPTQFSPAIPASKGIQHGITTASIPEADAVESEAGGLLGWMKGAVGSGGILFKVAEKAKSSVDSIVTTLDPQMREFMYTGGDINVLVASKQEVKISAIREAFQSTFGKAIVNGIDAQSSNIAVQPVGFASAVKAAEERIQSVRNSTNSSEPPLPVVAIENFLLEIGEERWFDLGVLLLDDPMKQIHLQVFTQMTPVPVEIVNMAQEDTPTDYPLKWSGLSVPVGSLMANNLHVHHAEWHEALTGVSRRNIILMAAKALASLYKKTID